MADIADSKKDMSIRDKIKELEKELSTTKYNKRTQHHIGLVKAKIATLKDKEMKKAAGKGKTEGYHVRKTGDASAILVGFPSVGKSTLLNKLTNADSEIGHYSFTTLDVVPGLLEYKHSKIQVLDVPGIVKGAASGRGRGKEVLSVMRNADLAIILIDVNFPEHLDVLRKEIYDTGLRLNERRPVVKIKKTSKDGIDIGTTVKLNRLEIRTAEAILRQFRINNAQVVIRSDITPDQFIDAIEANKIYIPAITVLNKIDMVSSERLEELKKELSPDICISAQEEEHLEELKELIFRKLRFIRIYCKEAGKKADLDVPLILKQGSTIRDMCTKLHKDFVVKFKFARVWGRSAKFGGQKLMLGHTLKDEDIVELHMR